MIIPIKCFTCGTVIADKYRYYLEDVRKRKLEKSMDVDKVSFVESSDALVASYKRKIGALRAGPERQALAGKKIALIEMGHTQSTVIIVDIGSSEEGVPTDLRQAYIVSLNCYIFN